MLATRQNLRYTQKGRAFMIHKCNIFLASLLLLALLAGCVQEGALISTDDMEHTTASTSPSEAESTAVTTEATTEVTTEAPTQGVVLPLYRFTDTVPDYDTTASAPFLVSTESISQERYAQYIHTPNLADYRYSDGAFLLCADEVEMKSGSHYRAYAVQNGQITELPRTTFSRTYSLYGNTYRIDFEYAVHQGQLLFTYAPNPEDYTEIRYPLCELGDGKCLVSINEFSTGVGRHHLMCLDLNTGDLTDYYAPLSEENRELAISHDFAYLTVLDSDRFVLRGSRDGFCYIDLARDIAFSLDALVGEELADFGIVGDDIVCWNSKNDFWFIDTATQTVSEFADLRRSAKAYSTFAIYEDDEDVGHIFDYVTQTDTAIAMPEGWEFSTSTNRSKDGRRFCFHKSEEDCTKYLFCDLDLMEFVELVITNVDPADIDKAGHSEWTEDGYFVIYARTHKDTAYDIYVYDIDAMFQTVN